MGYIGYIYTFMTKNIWMNYHNFTATEHLERCFIFGNRPGEFQLAQLMVSY